MLSTCRRRRAVGRADIGEELCGVAESVRRMGQGEERALKDDSQRQQESGRSSELLPTHTSPARAHYITYLQNKWTRANAECCSVTSAGFCSLG